MTQKFISTSFAVYGPDIHNEACHRPTNLSLIKDAMKTILDREEYIEFCKDVAGELNNKDDLDGIR
jgi:hypothetical protein